MKSTHSIKALVIRAAGTNCDQETVHALKLAGAETDLVHVNQLLTGRVRLHPYHMVVIPGGFSYGDDISAGKVLANELHLRLKDQLDRFILSRKLVIGICNGFQVLVKAGLLPGFGSTEKNQSVTLALNDSGRFQCEWVELSVELSAAGWLSGALNSAAMPIAHGEGKFICAGESVLKKLTKNNQVAFRYKGKNPNGSEDNIAGICNPMGNVIGLMPHPERFVSIYQHPNWPIRRTSHADGEGDGLWFWKSAVHYAKRTN